MDEDDDDEKEWEGRGTSSQGGYCCINFEAGTNPLLPQWLCFSTSELEVSSTILRRFCFWCEVGVVHRVSTKDLSSALHLGSKVRDGGWTHK